MRRAVRATARQKILIQLCDPVHRAGAEKVARIAAPRVIASLRRDQGLSEMTETAFSALARAWTTTMIAVSLLIVALALARAWDSSIYLQGLQEALKLDV